MNKRPLSQLMKTQQPNCINSCLLKTSIALTQQAQNLPSQAAAKFYTQYPNINKKYQQLQKSLLNSIKMLGKFFEVQPSNSHFDKLSKKAQVISYSVQVFQQITDSIQTHAKRFEENRNKIRRINEQQNEIGKQNMRPQDKYRFIKPASFSKHPHQLQISNMSLINFNNRKDCNIKQSLPLSQKPVYVDTQKQLSQMIQQLSQEKQIAVDLQHSSKSYYGMTSLIQISSRTKDYIVDVFPIWEVLQKKSQQINEKIFMNPNITKVMHGAEMDVKWLQRDFDIHISNLFDTFKASRILGFPKYSLAFLLQKYVHFNADKSYQTADWRIRPLTQQMLHYARCDTHYLLEIWDHLRNQLTREAQNKNLRPEDVINQVHDSSAQFTQKQAQLFQYEKIDLYVDLKYQFSQQDFIIIDKIFRRINQVAYNNNEDFYDVVPKRFLNQSLLHVKNLIYAKNNVLNTNKKKSVNSRNNKIDSFILAIRKSKYQGQKLGQLVRVLKAQLDSFFNTDQNDQTAQVQQVLTFKNSLSKKQKISKIQKMEQQSLNKDQRTSQTQQMIQPLRFFKLQLQLSQWCTESFQSKLKASQMTKNIIVKPTYEPLIKFISKKLGIQAKQDKQEGENMMIDQGQQAQQDLHDRQQGNVQGEQQDAKQIKFTNYKHNVNYQVQDPEEGLIAKGSQPKKKRKQEQYQRKVKSQKGNIYSYFEQN